MKNSAPTIAANPMSSTAKQLCLCLVLLGASLCSCSRSQQATGNKGEGSSAAAGAAPSSTARASSRSRPTAAPGASAPGKDECYTLCAKQMSLEPTEFCTADCRSGKIPKEHLRDPTKAAESYLRDSPDPDEPVSEDDAADDGDSEAAALQAADMGMGAAPAPKKQSSWGPVSVRVSQGDANVTPIRVDISHSLTALRRCKAGALEPGAIGKVALRLERDGEHVKLEPAQPLETGFLKCLRWVLLGGSGQDGAIRPPSRQFVNSGAVVAVQLDLEG